MPLTPLIDVVFILLLFFMLSSTFVRYQHIEFKAAASTGGQSEGESVRLILRENGQVSVDSVLFAPDSAAFLKRVTEWKKTTTKVIVTPESGTDIQSVVELLDQLRKSGLNKLNLSESVKP